ncbi:MAG: hypothetical protein MJE77_39370 [Proteobacteria bacterium]|nr:hypothetical protein [Pseudomonadota bacterium]
MGSISLTIKTPRQLEKQIRFAASRAINDAAFDVRAALVDSLETSFTVRNTYSARGFRVQKAKRSDLTAVVGQQREYLVEHVVGGRRRRGAIPTWAVRRNPKRAVRRSRWPGRLLEQLQ